MNRFLMLQTRRNTKGQGRRFFPIISSNRRIGLVQQTRDLVLRQIPTNPEEEPIRTLQGAWKHCKDAWQETTSSEDSKMDKKEAFIEAYENLQSEIASLKNLNQLQLEALRQRANQAWEPHRHYLNEVGIIRPETPALFESLGLTPMSSLFKKIREASKTRECDFQQDVFSKTGKRVSGDEIVLLLAIHRHISENIETAQLDQQETALIIGWEDNKKRAYFDLKNIVQGIFNFKEAKNLNSSNLAAILCMFNFQVTMGSEERQRVVAVSPKTSLERMGTNKSFLPRYR